MNKQQREVLIDAMMEMTTAEIAEVYLDAIERKDKRKKEREKIHEDIRKYKPQR